MAAIFNYRTPMELLNNTKTEFLNSYTDFQDTRYPDIGRYWFSVDGAYECWEPSWYCCIPLFTLTWKLDAMLVEADIFENDASF